MLNADRLAKLQDVLAQQNLDALFIEASTDLIYMADLDLHSDERVKGLMIAKGGRLFAMAPGIYYEEMRGNLGEDVIYQVWEDSEGFLDAWNKGCAALGLENGRIAINNGLRAIDLIDIMSASNARYVNGDLTLAALRSKKDAHEIAFMRTAAEMADEVIRRLAKFIKPAMTEKVIAVRIAELFDELGADSKSFNPIVASGPNGAMPHYGGNARRIEDNDVIILDLGCRCENYCSDITRTLFVGKPTKKQLEVYDVVLRAQNAGEAAVKPGVTSEEVDAAARNVIIEAGYGKYFGNRIGHGIGIAVHESPNIIAGSKHALEAGNTFSIEPGIYLAGDFGVRIENIVCVTQDGCEALNKVTKEVVICA